MRAWIAIFASAVVTGTIGCGGGGSSSPQNRNSVLTITPASATTVVGYTQPFTVRSDGTDVTPSAALSVAPAAAGTVFNGSIRAQTSGQATVSATSGSIVANSPWHIADASELYVYANAYLQSNLFAFRLEAGNPRLIPFDPGALWVSTPSNFQGTDLHLDVSGHYVYTSCERCMASSPGLAVSTESGLAHQIRGEAPEPNLLGIDPGGRHLYGQNFEYSIDPETGALKQLKSLPFAYAMTFTPDGTFAFRTSGPAAQTATAYTLTSYQVNAFTGDLSKVQELQFGTAPGWVLEYDPVRHNLYTDASDPTYTPAAFSVADDGRLTQVAVPPELGMAIHPTGRFLYRANSLGGIDGYERTSTGDLIPIAGSPFPAQSCAPVAFEPTGRYMLAAAKVYGDGANGPTNLVVFEIDLGSGALTNRASFSLNGLPLGAVLVNGGG